MSETLSRNEIAKLGQQYLKIRIAPNEVRISGHELCLAIRTLKRSDNIRPSAFTPLETPLNVMGKPGHQYLKAVNGHIWVVIQAILIMNVVRLTTDSRSLDLGPISDRWDLGHQKSDSRFGSISDSFQIWGYLGGYSRIDVPVRKELSEHPY